MNLPHEEALALVRDLRTALLDDGDADNAPAPEQLEHAATLFDDPNRPFLGRGRELDQGGSTGKIHSGRHLAEWVVCF
jgi:hypothetical protein